MVQMLLRFLESEMYWPFSRTKPLSTTDIGSLQEQSHDGLRFGERTPTSPDKIFGM